MRTKILRQVHKSKSGKVVLNNLDLEGHERATVFRIANFGLDVETIIPSHIPHSKNPDLLLMGTFWEMKGPTKLNESTITTKFRKAIKQSGGKAVFDLNNVKTNPIEVEEFILKLFKEMRGMRRIIIIRKDGTAVDIIK